MSKFRLGRTRPSFGFTLVELLVVIAIIGVLVALLLPAIQSAREAARRMSCSNNLKQLALGVHLYADVNKNFPPGISNAGTVDNYSWGAILLPHIEQTGLYDTLGVAATPSRDPSAVFVASTATPTVTQIFNTNTVISTFVCPSDSAPELNTNRQVNALSIGTSSYVGVHDSNGSSTGTKDNYDGCFGISPINNRASLIGFRDITDGTSNTLLLGERTWTVGTAPGNASSGNALAINDATSTGNTGGIFDVLGNGTGAVNTTAAPQITFSSAHPGGAQFAMADASVQFIPETIAYDNSILANAVGSAVYQRLMSRNDGQPVGEF